jgi:hypothetical protein
VNRGLIWVRLGICYEASFIRTGMGWDAFFERSSEVDGHGMGVGVACFL